MLVDITSVTHAVQYAQKIARKMSKDPEVDSLAGEAAWRALYTYDINRGVKLSWWIAQLTKQAVQYYWRRLAVLRKREKLMDELWWQEQSTCDNTETDIDIATTDWQLLIESFVLGWPLDVIARERGISIGMVKKLRNAAIARLEAKC